MICTGDMKDKLRLVLHMFDDNGDQKLSAAEVRRALGAMSPIPVADPEATDWSHQKKPARHPRSHQQHLNTLVDQAFRLLQRDLHQGRVEIGSMVARPVFETFEPWLESMSRGIELRLEEAVHQVGAVSIPRPNTIPRPNFSISPAAKPPTAKPFHMVGSNELHRITPARLTAAFDRHANSGGRVSRAEFVRLMQSLSHLSLIHI
eukprot:TRINITY_DN44589_c0_g1_i1.p1 TRINITY_DN44589_c0_g1~~TRINITY_DN44589_c0_g1_i1.p1  ORF type:complete len:205 (+),score=44.71 TRINITY_DN44589_c0_g1_i1:135-749(+)